MSEPVLVGLLFADRVITEDNGKKGIIGTFNQFFTQTFPVVFRPWSIYAAVTNLTAREHEFSLVLSFDETDAIIFTVNGKFENKSFQDIIEIPVNVEAAVFPQAGKYNLIFNVDGQALGARILLVNNMADKPSPA